MGAAKRFSCYGLALGVLSSCLVNRVWVPTTVRVAEFLQDGGREHRIRRFGANSTGFPALDKIRSLEVVYLIVMREIRCEHG
jgi:hypothetical protein